MSHSPEAGIENKSYRDGWIAVHRMIRQGKSWSGRERHSAFLNTGGARFADVSAVAGIDLQADGRALARVDWDQDGGIDFWTSNRNAPRVHLFRNRRADGNHWVQLDLVGSGGNRDAIGARVEVVPRDAAGELRYVKTLHAGEGFLSQSSKTMHFGLGAAEAIERVIVRWPGAGEEVFEGVQIDRRQVLGQGSGAAQALPARAVALASSTPDAPRASGRGRVALAAPLPMPRMLYAQADTTASLVPIAFEPGRAVLVNLWASWCANCRKELDAFHEHAAELDAAGVDVLALSVDEEAERPAALKFLADLGWGEASGWAPSELLDVLRTAEEEVLDPLRELALPTSFLLSGTGRLVAIYRGPVEVETLVRDAALIDLDALALRDAVVPFPGRWVGPTPVADLLTFANRLRDRGHLALAADYLARLGPRNPEGGGDEATRSLAQSLVLLGADLTRDGLLPTALETYKRAVALDAELALAHQGIGIVLSELREDARAIRALQRARGLDPKDARTPYLVGVILARGERFVEAIAAFDQSLSLNPKNVKAHFNRGAVFSKQGRVDQAIEAIRKARTIEPAYLQAHRAEAQILHARKRLPEALNAYRSALALQPNHAGTLVAFGVAQVEIGDRAGALRTLQRLMPLDANLAAQLQAEISRVR
ncbi:MAG: tetratricopeptide repeat protein [bacterium]|nr:tetratricopeptide repeat protein [bacterium]